MPPEVTPPRMIAITGSHGQLGSALSRRIGAGALNLARPGFDLGNFQECRQQLRSLRPTVVINCAAYVQVDVAEREPDKCELINTKSVAMLADMCDELDACLVQISTDYVFDGMSGRGTPWREDDEIHPVGVYARSKAMAENEVARIQRHLIVRTCGLYGHTAKRNNFVETMLRLGRERSHVRVVNDQHCTPTYVEHLAQSILYLISQDERGLFHITNRGATTWHDFAAEIFRLARLPAQLEAITTSDYNAPATRPAYSVLDTARYHNLGGPPMPNWQEALAEYLATREN